MSKDAFQILLVEDNPGDVLLFRKALESAGFDHTLHVATDGIQALDFMGRKGEYADAPTPNLVVLDLELPRKSGREVLLELKADPVLQEIPVLVLTTSARAEDVQASYAGRASTYIEKAHDLQGYRDVVFHIERYWLASARAEG